jgi:hypothetical protein
MPPVYRKGRGKSSRTGGGCPCGAEYGKNKKSLIAKRLSFLFFSAIIASEKWSAIVWTDGDDMLPF